MRLLASHGWEPTLALLLRCTEALPPPDVVRQLEPRGGGGSAGGGAGAGGGAEAEVELRRLHEYLHGLYVKDLHGSACFHTRQLELCA